MFIRHFACLLILLLVLLVSSCRRADGAFTLTGGQPTSFTGEISLSRPAVRAGGEVNLTISVSNPDGLILSFSWSDGVADEGEFSGQVDGEAGSSVTWSAGAPGEYAIKVTLTDEFGRTSFSTTLIEVRVAGEVDADVVSKFVDSVDDYFSAEADWSEIEGGTFTPTGNPSTGSHGALGDDIAPFELKSVYDDDEMLLLASWEDDSQDDVGELWTFDGDSWSLSGDEDRFSVMWPILDGAGRAGLTFAEAGCAIACHRAEPDPVEMIPLIVPDTESPLSSCAVCHDQSPGTMDEIPSFSHTTLSEALKNNCAACHGVDMKVGVGTAPGASDMIAPEGASFDIWNWRSASSDPAGGAEDQFTSSGNPRTADSSGAAAENLAGDGASPLYVWADERAGTGSENRLFASEFEVLDSESAIAEWNAETSRYEFNADGSEFTPSAGDSVPGWYFTDSGSDVIDTVSSFSDGRWTVILRRSLTSGDTTEDRDIDFDIFEVVTLSAVYKDNSSMEHRGYNLITLGFGS